MNIRALLFLCMLVLVGCYSMPRPIPIFSQKYSYVPDENGVICFEKYSPDNKYYELFVQRVFDKKEFILSRASTELQAYELEPGAYVIKAMRVSETISSGTAPPTTNTRIFTLKQTPVTIKSGVVNYIGTIYVSADLGFFVFVAATIDIKSVDNTNRVQSLIQAPRSILKDLKFESNFINIQWEKE